MKDIDRASVPPHPLSAEEPRMDPTAAVENVGLPASLSCSQSVTGRLMCTPPEQARLLSESAYPVPAFVLSLAISFSSPSRPEGCRDPLYQLKQLRLRVSSGMAQGLWEPRSA